MSWFSTAELMEMARCRAPLWEREYPHPDYPIWEDIEYEVHEAWCHHLHTTEIPVRTEGMYGEYQDEEQSAQALYLLMPNGGLLVNVEHWSPPHRMYRVYRVSIYQTPYTKDRLLGPDLGADLITRVRALPLDGKAQLLSAMHRMVHPWTYPQGANTLRAQRRYGNNHVAAQIHVLRNGRYRSNTYDPGEDDGPEGPDFDTLNEAMSAADQVLRSGRGLDFVEEGDIAVPDTTMTRAELLMRED